jgi:hypothetical protein
MSLKVETLTEFFDLIATHDCSFKIEGDGKTVCVSVGYPKGMKPKIRDAMRDWAADNEAELVLAVIALAKGWEPPGLDVEKLEIEGQPPFQPVTAVH